MPSICQQKGKKLKTLTFSTTVMVDLSDRVFRHPYWLVKVITSTKCTGCHNDFAISHIFFVSSRNSEPSILIIEATMHRHTFLGL
jgi:hypothetical protein